MGRYHIQNTLLREARRLPGEEKIVIKESRMKRYFSLIVEEFPFLDTDPPAIAMLRHYRAGERRLSGFSDL